MYFKNYTINHSITKFKTKILISTAHNLFINMSLRNLFNKIVNNGSRGDVQFIVMLVHY